VQDEDGAHDLVCGAGFLQPAGDAGLEGLEKLVPVFLGGEEQDGGVGQGFMELLDL
jgi:hypothetical protein